jgi:hypothetical protein
LELAAIRAVDLAELCHDGVDKVGVFQRRLA